MAVIKGDSVVSPGTNPNSGTPGSPIRFQELPPSPFNDIPERSIDALRDFQSPALGTMDLPDRPVDTKNKAARDALLEQKEYTFGEVFDAASEVWLPKRISRWIDKYQFNKDHSEKDPDFSLYDFLSGVNKVNPRTYSEDELQYLQDNSDNADQAARAILRLNQLQDFSKVTTDNKLLSTAVSFLDPVSIMLPASYGIRAAGAVGAAATLGASAGIGVALGTIGDRPHGTVDILKDALLFGGMGLLFKKSQVVLPTSVTELQNGISGIRSVLQREAPAATEAADTTVRNLNRRLEWSLSKEMGNTGQNGKRVADELLDNPSDFSKVSVESYKEANLGYLRELQFPVEDAVMAEMARRGATTLKMMNPFTARKARETQQQVETELMQEMANREAIAKGLTQPYPRASKGVQDIADRLGELNTRAADLMRRNGVEGAEDLVGSNWYVHRKWDSARIENILHSLETSGMSRQEARSALDDMLSLSIQRGSGIKKSAADTIAKAMLSRVEQQAMGKNVKLMQGIENADPVMIKQSLGTLGVPADTAEQIAKDITEGINEARKAGHLKDRLDIDYSVHIVMPDGRKLGVLDLVDQNTSTLVDTYIKKVAGDTALAQKGYGNATKIATLRDEFLSGVPAGSSRAEAERLFDNTIAAIRGEAHGADQSRGFRTLMGITRTTGLPNSGLWQTTEIAQALAEFGALNTARAFIKTMPGFNKIFRPSKSTAKQLDTVLGEYSSQSVRMRPFIMRYEDGYDMGAGSAIELATQATGNAIPYVNGLRFIHHHQANMTGNLMLQRLHEAVTGNKTAARLLEKDGITVSDLSMLKQEVSRHGFEVDKWAPATWDAVRPKLYRMMDALVLKGRLGDLPAFMQFDAVGKFLGTFRTFTFTAHNKLLVGGLNRNGAGAVGLLLMYQFPLAMAAVQTQAVLSGKGVMSDEAAATSAVGVMGGIGLFSDVFKIASGESRELGTPGMLFVDRTVSTAGAVLQGDARRAAKNATGLIPLVASVPFTRGLANTAFGNE